MPLPLFAGGLSAAGGLLARFGGTAAKWLLPSSAVWVAGKGVQNATDGAAGLARETGKTASTVVAVGAVAALAVMFWPRRRNVRR